MSESLVTKRTEGCHEVEMKPKHHRTLGAGHREVREMVQREQETERLATTHRLRINRKIDALERTGLEAFLMFQGTVAASVAAESGSLDEDMVHATLLHAVTAGLEHLLHPLLYALGPVGFVAEAALAVALHAGAGRHAAAKGSELRTHLLDMGEAIIQRATRVLHRNVEQLRERCANTADDALAADERMLLEHHAIYESSTSYFSAETLALVDDEFLEASQNLPRTSAAEALSMAAVMTREFQPAMARVHNAHHAVDEALEIAANPLLSLLFERAMADGSVWRASDVRGRREILGAAKP